MFHFFFLEFGFNLNVTVVEEEGALVETVDVDQTVTRKLNIGLESKEGLAPYRVDGPEHLDSSCFLVYPLLMGKLL